ncbi:glycosyltransferase involved in cell wall biosynthesis [Pedobacter sp. UYEF25]
MDNLKISIITVVYNNERTLETAIKSVLSQTYDNIEYIIIDGSSTDNTMHIIDGYASKISVVVSEPDKGIYDAMNKGISKATGSVIGILNSDDVYNDENVILEVMSYFNTNVAIDIVYGDLVYVKYEDLSKVVRKWDSLSYYKSYFEDGNVPPHPALFVRREVYSVAGLFNIQLRLAADYEFMLRIFKRYNFKSFYFNRLLVKMRLGGASNSSIKNISDGNREVLRAWRNNQLKVPFLLMPKRFFKRIIQFIK